MRNYTERAKSKLSTSSQGQNVKTCKLSFKRTVQCISSFLTITYTGKKENKIFLIYKEIQKGAVAKSYMYEEGLPNI